MKVALVYDRVNKWGGAERLLLTLHEIFPDAPLYTSVYNPKKASWADVFKVKTSFLQKLPFASLRHDIYATFMPIAFESFSFDEYDVVISVASEAAKGIITKPKTLHINYCLTPTRYLWSGYKEYFKNPLFRAIAYPAVYYLRVWDYVASRRPDVYIAISKEVKGRIKKYYDKESEVIYPPISIHNSEFTPQNLKQDSFFLVVSRLVPYKRIDIAIRACNKLRLPLKIVGVGSEEKRLKRIAGPTVEFLGSLTDSELLRYYKACLALLFPGYEDFGMVMGEAQSFGKPIIAFKGGGALELIKEGKTGRFFYPQNTEALIKCLATFKPDNFSANTIQDWAKKFGNDRFKKEFLDRVSALFKEHINNT